MKKTLIPIIVACIAALSAIAATPPATLSPADADKLFKVVLTAAESDHYPVYLKDLLKQHDYDGDSDGEEITIDSSLTGVEKVYVLIHEYSHSVLHYGKYSIVDSSRPDVDDDTSEYEAESIAHTVARALGVDDPESDFAANPIPNCRPDLIQKAINYIYHKIITTNASMKTGLTFSPNPDLTYNEWPARMFAPYMYVGDGDNFKITDGDKMADLKHYTIAFIIAMQNNDSYLPQPSWDGRIPIEQNFYRNQIRAIRERGGDVIVSFGGEAGREIANVIQDPATLEADYEKIINRYKLTWLDFDIEGHNLDRGREASERRNTALADIQKQDPAVLVSYTLPVDPNGLSDASLALLSDAKSKGLKVATVNLMVMYFGSDFIGKGKSEGQLGIDSANAAYQQIQKIDPAIQVSLCPCIGQNGSHDEVFTTDDAKTLRAFADKTPWVRMLTYWSINDDARGAAGAAPWAFANVFKTYATKSTQSQLW